MVVIRIEIITSEIANSFRIIILLSYFFTSYYRKTFQGTGLKCMIVHLAVKDLLLPSSVLIPLNKKFPIIVTCDAYSYGVVSVFRHEFPDVREDAIAYALGRGVALGRDVRTLTSTVRNYP